MRIKATGSLKVSMQTTLVTCTSNINEHRQWTTAMITRWRTSLAMPRRRLCHPKQTRDSIATLKQLHSRLIIVYHPPDPTTHPSSARELFDAISQRSTRSYNALIRGYVNCGHHRDAFLVFCNMGEGGMGPDNYTLPCVLKACVGMRSLLGGMQVHGCAVGHGLEQNVFVGNALISMYAKCGSTAAAQSLFEGMAYYRDVVSWNTIIAGYAQQGKVDLAVEMCKKMVAVSQVRPDDGTVASILPALMNAVPSNLIFIRRLFDGMSCKGLIAWNAMITMYVSNGMATDAVELFTKMEAEGIEPNEVTFASILPACGDLSAFQLGDKIRRHVKWKRMGGNLLLENALIDMYAKCGYLERAREVFDAMHERDVVSWTVLISAYGMSGRGHDAIDLFEQMQRSGVHPDKITFVSILSACSHSGLLDKARQYFRCMTDIYHIVPTLEHFSCMVDLLGRSGNIEEAYTLVKAMPIDPNERVWGSLLNACQIFSNMTIGLLVADKLFALVPEHSGYLVLLSNIYAKAGRWEDVTLLRNKMKSKGLKKLPAIAM